MSAKPHAQGVYSAAPTVFSSNGAPHINATIAIWRHLLQDTVGNDGLIVFGSTGEAHSVAMHERMRIVRAAAEQGLPVERIWIGTATSSITEAADLAELAATYDYAGILMMPPHYYRGADEAGIAAWMLAVAERAAQTSILLYHIPKMTGVPITHGLIDTLLDAGASVVGLKDSSGDLASLQGFIDAYPQLAILSGNELLLGDARGVQGTISAVANITAPLLHRAWHNKDAAAQELAFAIRRAIQGGDMIPHVKSWLAQDVDNPELTRLLGNCAPPLHSVPLTEALNELRARMQQFLGNDS